jgi:hypothetical protein
VTLLMIGYTALLLLWRIGVGLYSEPTMYEVERCRISYDSQRNIIGGSSKPFRHDIKCIQSIYHPEQVLIYLFLLGGTSESKGSRHTRRYIVHADRRPAAARV